MNQILKPNEEPRHPGHRERLSCNFRELDEFFDDCLDEALALLSDQGVEDYLEGASLVCKIGRGFDPVLVYLEEMPQVADRLGEDMLLHVSQRVWKMSRTPNGRSILPFLQSLPEAARRLGSAEQFERYLDLVFELMEKTTSSIHGFHQTIPSPCLPGFLEQTPYLLRQLSIAGIRDWADYGAQYYNDHPERQIEYFTLQSADSRAVLQRERHGTLFADIERELNLYLKCLWNDKDYLVPYSVGWDVDEYQKPRPYYDGMGIRIPDVYDDTESGVSGIDRYRAVLAHIAGHRRWTEKMVVDNLSPFQRAAIEKFEDARVEYLVMKQYPGLRRLFLSLHPVPIEGGCDSENYSCIRHRLAMLSYACLNPEHGYQDENIVEYANRFYAVMEEGESSSREMANIAVSFIAKTRQQNDQKPTMYFKNTEIEYRDDNRHMWIYLEEGDDEEQFDKANTTQDENELEALPPRHYPEWDYTTQMYRPDWVSLYETLHPPGNASKIDDLLAKHAALVKRLKQMLELLKPQRFVRVRYQEDGSELDLDVAIRSLIDFKSGANPDPRINMSHKHDGRDIAVMLLLDLSASLNDIPDGCSQTILELSQEAVSLLGIAIEGLGDNFAIAGFSSNTRHEVRYQHIKGYGEHWGEEVKARLAGMEAGYSTRMGAAIRHASHYLSAQQADKKLLLVLTDGEPSDIDVNDPQMLIEDTRKSVIEASQEGIYTYCINLDARADDYVRDIFGKQYTVIDKIERLPEKLPQLFMSLTG